MAIWVGLSLGCCFGYYLGHASGVVMLPRYINSKDAQKAHQLCDKLGSGLLILMRAVPVLAEASVISAGMVGMPFVRFVVVTSLANIGLAISYAYIGTMALSSQSFLLVFVGAVAVPVTSWVLLIMLEKIVRLFRQTISVNFNEKALKRNIIHAEFAVNYTYPVLFTENVFNPANTCLRDVMVKANVNIKKQKVINALVFIDEGLYQNVPDLPSNVEKYFQSHRAVINLVGKNVLVPGGEVAKSSTQIDITQYAMLNCDLDRHAFVIIIGGGSVLDAVGYAAATFHRGVKVIRLPSTVLAQNDAGIGVKNGINAHGIKNLIGSFTPPHAVINDSVWLTTLSERDSRAGLAEAVKVAAIKDPAFFEWLEQHAHELAAFETESMHYMIYRCAELHLEQISRGGDPFEKGNARPLDYGHWCAHKLESLSDYELKHGEAVAIGMALDARYACNMGMLEEAESLRLIHLLQRLGFNLWHEALDIVSEDGQAMILQGLDDIWVEPYRLPN